MPVSLPTAADVRRAREQAAQAAAERAGVARTPLLAVLGAGDYAYTSVTKAVGGARSRATAQAEDVQHRVAELPQRLSPEALLTLVAELRAEAEERYGYFARRGESTWGWLRKQPPLERTIATIETYTEKLDARVDGLVDDAHDVAEMALTTVTRQTRSTGEKAARTTRRVAAGTAEVVAEVAHDASETVAEAGEDVAATIADAGAEAAATARSTSRRAAHRTEPRTTTPEAAPAPTAPKATAPKATTPKGTAPKGTTPKGTAPKAKARKATAPKATAPKAATAATAAPAPKSADPRSAASPSAPKSAAPTPAAGKPAESTAPKPAESTAPKPAQSKSAEHEPAGPAGR